MVNGPHGNHFCVAYEYLGVSLATFLERFDWKEIPERLKKMIIKQILIGLDYLHNTCEVMHNNIKPENILFKIDDKECVR